MKTKPINLALQGGGSHGALTWGVLDRLLQEQSLTIAEISGTSAGAMNAVVLADGYAKGGRDGARTALHDFWYAVSESARFSPLQRSPWAKMQGQFTLDDSPGYWWLENMSRLFSPYELNPFDINPLRDILVAHVDFARLQQWDDIRLHIGTTAVKTGMSKVFSGAQVSLDAVMASACLPQMYKAVEIDGEAYWDGGYSANPALMPLVLSERSADILIVQINPVVREAIPKNARDILNRINEISFNSALIKELQAIAAFQNALAGTKIDLGPASTTYVHLIHCYRDVATMSASSKLNAEWVYLQTLFEQGRRWADVWLTQHYDAIGQCATFDLAGWLGTNDEPILPPGSCG